MSKKFEGKGRGYHPVEELADTLCVAIRSLHRGVEDDHIPFFRCEHPSVLIRTK
jgi:hypothetical protein